MGRLLFRYDSLKYLNEYLKRCLHVKKQEVFQQGLHGQADVINGNNIGNSPGPHPIVMHLFGVFNNNQFNASLRHISNERRQHSEQINILLFERRWSYREGYDRINLLVSYFVLGTVRGGPQKKETHFKKLAGGNLFLCVHICKI